MNQEEAAALYEWAVNLIGEIVKYPSGMKKKTLTDHIVLNVTKPFSLTENKDVKKFRISVGVRNIKTGKEFTLAVKELKKYNPDL